MVNKKKIVYTSLPAFSEYNRRAKYVGCWSLPNADWIREKINEMSTTNPSYAEEKFLELCKSFKYNLFRQVYFNIDGNGYFLDFFIPQKSLAIEIDGRYHQSEEQKKHDEERDARFRSIGIRTIRFTTDEIRDADFYQKYYCPRLKNLGFKIKPKSQISAHQKKLMDAIALLNNVENNSTIEIRSNSTAFLRAVSRNGPSKNAKCLPLVYEFYNTKKKKNIRVVCRFSGSGLKMKKGERRWIMRLEEICNKAQAKLVYSI